MKHRITLLSRKIIEDDDGHFTEEYKDICQVWGRLTLMRSGVQRDSNDWGILSVNAEKNHYRLVMQKNYNRNALHAEIYGLRFRGRVLKLLSPLDMITDDLFIEAVVVDSGEENGE